MQTVIFYIPSSWASLPVLCFHSGDNHGRRAYGFMWLFFCLTRIAPSGNFFICGTNAHSRMNWLDFQKKTCSLRKNVYGHDSGIHTQMTKFIG